MNKSFSSSCKEERFSYCLRGFFIVLSARNAKTDFILTPTLRYSVGKLYIAAKLRSDKQEIFVSAHKTKRILTRYFKINVFHAEHDHC